jgi:tRNA U34 5-carboxymethylaminomethyl modifying GTPase MnmE/TrmE
VQQKKDTIYALSTCYGKSGVAIIRVSGPESLRVLNSISDFYTYLCAIDLGLLRLSGISIKTALLFISLS